jgi:hypothetical protein
MELKQFWHLDSRNKDRDGQLMESMYLLAPEWDSTYDIDACTIENDDGLKRGKSY